MKKSCVKLFSVICFVIFLLQTVSPLAGAVSSDLEKEAKREKLIAELDELYADQDDFTYKVEEDGHTITYTYKDSDIGSFSVDLESGTGNQAYVDEIMQTAQMTPPVQTEEAEEEKEPVILEEEISERGEYEKHFKCGDGSMLAVSYSYPVHRQNAIGSWEEIDNTLFEKDGKLCTKSSDFSVALAQEVNNSDIISITDSGHTLIWSLQNKNETKAKSGFIAKLFGASEDKAVKAKIVEDTTVLSANEEKLAQKKIQSTVRYSDILAKSVDVEYTVLPGKIKENIILEKKSDFTDYSMTVNTGDLTAIHNSDNSVDFCDINGNVIFTLETPYMYDAADEISYDIKLYIKSANGKTVIDFYPNADWLNDAGRKYPLVIDPSVTTPKTSSNTVDTYVYDGCSASSARANEEKLYVGLKPANSSAKAHRIYWKAKQLPSISVPAAITKATFYMKFYAGTTSSKQFTFYSTNGKWDPSTLNWANRPGGTQLQTAVERNTSTNMITFTSAETTNIVRDWYSGRNANNGFLIKYRNEADPNKDYNSFYSSENTTNVNYMPYMIVEYQAPSQNIADGVYRFRNGYSGMYMTYEKIGNKDDHTTNVAQYNYIPGTPIQLWDVKYVSNGFYKISPHLDSIHCLDIQGGTDADNSNVQTYQSNGTNAQLFRFINCGDGSYLIMPKNGNSRVIGNDGKNSNNGQNINTWRYAGEPHQRWNIENRTNSVNKTIYHMRSLPITSIVNDTYFEKSRDYMWGDKSESALLNYTYLGGSSNIDKSETLHYNNMRDLFSAYSYGSLQEVLIGPESGNDGNNMLDRFYNGGGTSFSNAVLTDAVMYSLANNKYHSKLKKSFTDVFKNNNYNISAFNYDDSARESQPFVIRLFNDKVVVPFYDKTYVNGLAIMVHGWQSHSIEVKSITQTSNEYDITLTLKYWDIFGLDDNDFDQPDMLNGFSSWYILQHYNTYGGAHKPFITYVSYDYNFKVNK